jgi:hypothetical protein
VRLRVVQRIAVGSNENRQQCLLGFRSLCGYLKMALSSYTLCPDLSCSRPS